MNSSTEAYKKITRTVSIDLVSQIPGCERFTWDFLSQIIETDSDYDWDTGYSHISFYGLIEFGAVIKIEEETLIDLDNLDGWAKYYGLK